MQMLPDDPEVLQMLHEVVNESDIAEERSMQADSAWLWQSHDDAIDA